jgi:hypothetical protein
MAVVSAAEATPLSVGGTEPTTEPVAVGSASPAAMVNFGPMARTPTAETGATTMTAAATGSRLMGWFLCYRR